MPETTAEFLHTQRETRHKCGTVADMIGGDIEMHFCPECLELDTQAVFALNAALTAFKATGMKLDCTPSFNEDEEAAPNIHIIVPEHVRMWSFYVPDIKGTDDEYYAIIILKADGKYEVFRAP